MRAARRARTAEAESTNPAGEVDSRSIRKPLPTKPKTERQAQLQEALKSYRLVITLGPPGTGKTFIPICHAIDAIAEKRLQRLTVIRPTMEAGDPVGFLPGTLQEKMDPFLANVYDAVCVKFGSTSFGNRWIKDALAKQDPVLVTLPVNYLRGQTFRDSLVVVDEAQNLTYKQLKLVITRLGPGTTIVFNGDTGQSDLRDGSSGLLELQHRIGDLDCVATIRFTEDDCVRDPLLARILPRL